MSLKPHQIHLEKKLHGLFGLDFSHVKLYGTTTDFSDLPNIKNHYFSAWNELVLKESIKYDIDAIYQKKKLATNLEVVTKRNATVDETKLLSPDNITSPNLTQDDIGNIINEYKGKGSGVGIVYIIDSFNKMTSKGIIHVVFFNINDGKIFFTQHYTNDAGGFGFRNFWASTIHRTLRQSKITYLEEMKKAKKAAKQAAKKNKKNKKNFNTK